MRSASDIKQFLMEHRDASHHVRLELLSHHHARGGTAAANADLVVQSLGFKAIGTLSWRPLTPEAAKALAKLMIWRGLAYNNELMIEKTAELIAARLVESLNPYTASLAANGAIEGATKLWTPIRSATFEMALVGHDGTGSFLLYASDED